MYVLNVKKKHAYGEHKIYKEPFLGPKGVPKMQLLLYREV